MICSQDCACLVAPQPYTQLRTLILILIWIWLVVTGGMLGLSCSSIVLFAPLAQSGSLARQSQHKELALVVSTLIPSQWLSPNAIMQRTEVPMFYDTASSSNLPTCIFAGLRMCWAGYHSCRASWAETGLRPCPIAMVAARGQWLTAAKGQAMATGFMSSTPECGVMAGGSRAGLLSQSLSSTVRLALPTLARGQQRLWSVAERSGARITIPEDPRLGLKRFYILCFIRVLYSSHILCDIYVI